MDLKTVDVVVCYLLPNTMQRIRKKLERELKPGARVISYAFPMTDWVPTHREERIREKSFCPIWVYQMPPAPGVLKSKEAKGKRAKTSATRKTQPKNKAPNAATKSPKGKTKKLNRSAPKTTNMATGITGATKTLAKGATKEKRSK